MRRLLLGAVILVCLLTVSWQQTPAEGALSIAQAADASGDIRDVFEDDEALFVYVVSDIAGGYVYVAHDTGSFGDGCGNPTSWTTPNFILSLGTVYSLIEPRLEPGTWRIRSTNSEGEPTGCSAPFTVVPCTDCDRTLTDAIVAEWKTNAAEGLRTFTAMTCASLKVLSLNPLNLIPTLHPAARNQEKAVEILRNVSCGVSLMYRNIVDDPPDFDYREIAPPVFEEMDETESPESAALAEVLDRQRAFGSASLTAFERYQGALVENASDRDAFLRAQTRAMASFIFSQTGEMVATSEAARTYATVVDGIDGLDIPIFPDMATRTNLIAELERIRVDGFSAEELTALQNAGYTPERIADLLDATEVDVTAIPIGLTLGDHMRDLADELEDYVPQFKAMGLDAAIVSARNNQAPIAGFTASVMEGEAPLEVQFTNTSVSTDLDPLTYRWQFGTGPQSTQEHPLRTYFAPGRYRVVLTASDGLAFGTHELEIVVNAPATAEPSPTPTVDPTIDSDGDGYLDVDELAIWKDHLGYCAVMRADVDHDGSVSIEDLQEVGSRLLQEGPGRYEQGLPDDRRGAISMLDVAAVAAEHGRPVSECPHGPQFVSDEIPGGLRANIVLDDDGFPVLAYIMPTDFPFNGDVMLLRCNDPFCSGGDDVPRVIGQGYSSITGGATAAYGLGLALTSDGNPVVAFPGPNPAVGTNPRVTIVICNDPFCDGDDETRFDPGLDAARRGVVYGGVRSLVLDDDDRPVLAFRGSSTSQPLLLRCADAVCTSASINALTVTQPSAIPPALRLDSAGNPVIAFDVTSSSSPIGIVVVRCIDPLCADEGMSVSPVLPLQYRFAHDLSMVLDTNGYPVLATWDEVSANGRYVQLIRCNDQGCLGGDETYTMLDPSTVGGVALGTAKTAPVIALDSADNPVITYLRNRQMPGAGHRNRIAMIRCGDPVCAKEIELVADVYVFPAVHSASSATAAHFAFDANDNPVIAVYDSGPTGLQGAGVTDDEVHVIRCSTPDCRDQAAGP